MSTGVTPAALLGALTEIQAELATMHRELDEVLEQHKGLDGASEELVVLASRADKLELRQANTEADVRALQNRASVAGLVLERVDRHLLVLLEHFQLQPGAAL